MESSWCGRLPVISAFRMNGMKCEILKMKNGRSKVQVKAIERTLCCVTSYYNVS